ncbi:MAG: imelysin family protein, partial [Saprospiraceae bacterium]
MNNLKRISLFCTVILMTVLFSCQEGGNNNSACSSDFDQGAMFTDLSDLISNKYTSASTDIASLKSAINTFTASPDATNLASTRLAFENAYLSFVATEPYLFGPAQENDLVKELNSFPVNSALLEANINSGSYNLDAPDNFYSGFPALDYLLYGV